MPDHFVDHDLAPTVALAHAAAVTDTLRVGPLVLGNDYKHPVVLAREMATLDLLSDGRLELGIGAGWMTADYEKAGIPLDRPGVRIARLAESITVLKGLFAPGPFTFHGEHYQVTELDGMPKPVQGANLPFLIGGGGTKILGARRARGEDRRHQREPAHRRGRVARDRAVAAPRGAPTRSSRGCATRPATGSTTSRSRRCSGSCTSPTTAPGSSKAMAGSFGVSEADAVLAPATLVGSVDEHRRAARGAARALADVVHRDPDRVDRNARAGRRAPRRKVGDA